jgi:two-component sensor histidine kinase
MNMPRIESLLAHFAQRRHAPLAYLVALIVTAGALAARAALQSLLPGSVFITLYPAVLVSAAVGGFWAGLLSTAIGGLAAWRLFWPSASTHADPAQAPWAGVIVFAVTGILISLVMRWLRGAIRQLEAERSKASALLREAEQSQARAETALAEMNHRVKNSLQIAASLLRLQAGSTADGTRDALQQAAARVDTVARVHLHLTGLKEIEQVNFERYLRDFCNEIGETWQSASTSLSWQIDCDSFTLPTRQAVALGLIINELLTNIMKYAYPGESHGTAIIRCQRTPEGATQLRVADAGVGLPAGFDPAQSHGLGMRIVAALCQQIGADLEIERSGRSGASFMITVPAA